MKVDGPSNYFEREGKFSQDVEFSFSVTHDMIDWWDANLGKFNLLPRDICRKLVADLPLDCAYKITRIDTVKGEVTAEVTADDYSGEVVLTERSIEIKENRLFLGFSNIRSDWRRHGFGRTLVRNCYRLARELNLHALAIIAVDMGSFTWALAGFVPDQMSWEGDKCRPPARKKLDELSDLNSDSRDLILEYLGSSAPEDLWEIADMEDVVLSTKEQESPVLVGYALLVESGATWRGGLDLNNINSKQIQRARHWLKLEESE